ncbi:winged helix-turn-helix domain-containing protein [Roseateles sp.]|uniref:winged helix-turn-helix domain-containing protein n=1 Tax=Roseateles sp. TaxID=1971397 RepID=UPI003265AD85
MTLPLSDAAPIDLARTPAFTLGATRVNPALREVVVAGQVEMLEPRVMQVLVALAEQRGQVISRDTLSQRCWSGRTVGDDALTRCIARVRRLAEASGDFNVETIPRVGYRLTAAEVEAEAKDEVEAAPAPQPAAPPVPARPQASTHPLDSKCSDRPCCIGSSRLSRLRRTG